MYNKMEDFALLTRLNNETSGVSPTFVLLVDEFLAEFSALYRIKLINDQYVFGDPIPLTMEELRTHSLAGVGGILVKNGQSVRIHRFD